MKAFLALIILTLSVSLYGELTFLPYYPFKMGERLVLTINVLGIYIGDQVINIEDSTSTNGRRYLVGSGHLYTTPFMSSFYKVDDRERTWFLPENFLPVYYERWINEGNWKDNIRFNFYPGENRVDIFQKANGFAKNTISYKGALRNYFTLIACMRSVDYDFHIQNGVNVEIDYLFGTAIKTAKFRPSFRETVFKGKKAGTIYLEEIGGIGMRFYLMNDSDRTPIRLVIPAFEVIGFKTINVEVELKEYTRGTIEIVPMGYIPAGAMEGVAITAVTNAGESSLSNAGALSANTNAVKKAVKPPVKKKALPAVKKTVPSVSTNAKSSKAASSKSSAK